MLRDLCYGVFLIKHPVFYYRMQWPSPHSLAGAAHGSGFRIADEPAVLSLKSETLSFYPLTKQSKMFSYYNCAI